MAVVATTSSGVGCEGRTFSSNLATGFLPAALPMLTDAGREGPGPTWREPSESSTKLAPQQKMRDRNEGFWVLASPTLRDFSEAGLVAFLDFCFPEAWGVEGCEALVAPEGPEDV